MMLRGGAWNNTTDNARSANRNRNQPANMNNNIGFRCASRFHALPKWDNFTELSLRQRNMENSRP